MLTAPHCDVCADCDQAPQRDWRHRVRIKVVRPTHLERKRLLMFSIRLVSIAHGPRRRLIRRFPSLDEVHQLGRKEPRADSEAKQEVRLRLRGEMTSIAGGPEAIPNAAISVAWTKNPARRRNGDEVRWPGTVLL